MATVLKMKPRNEVSPKPAVSKPAPKLDRTKTLLDQFGIENPLEIDDKNSISARRT